MPDYKSDEQKINYLKWINEQIAEHQQHIEGLLEQMRDAMNGRVV